jgi:uncharacterized RDD family membrane protein YckC
MKERAGFGVRLVALVIDMVLLVAISVVIGLMAGSSTAVLLHKLGFSAAIADPGSAALATGLMAIGVFLLVTSLVATFLSLPYNLMEAFFGWTPGKLATGLRVRNQDGSRPTLGQVFSRWLIKHNAILLALLTFVGLPVAIFSPFLQAAVFLGCFLALGQSRQALHDSLTHTAVYEVSQLESEADLSTL